MESNTPRTSDQNLETPADSARREGRPVLAGLMAGIVVSVLILWTAPSLREPFLFSGFPDPAAPVGEKQIRQAERRVEQLARKVRSRIPRGAYLVVSSSDNTFRLMQGEDVLREGLCSTGSYVQLRGHEGKEWLFETPRGGFRILDKRRNPVWVKPDWAFVEAGEPIPPPGSSKRYERGVLGDYAMALGDGYLIHGTLYQRLLGSPVTHGCVRLGDADLEAAFKALPIGARVFIY